MSLPKTFGHDCCLIASIHSLCTLVMQRVDAERWCVFRSLVIV